MKIPVFRLLPIPMLAIMMSAMLLTISCKREILEPSDLTEQNSDSRPFSTLATNVVQYKGVWYKAGDTIYGYKNYVKLVVGDANVPLMLGAPHDGVLIGSPEIPVSASSLRDLNVKPFAFSVAAHFKNDTGLQPWIIINEIYRSRVDPNTYPADVTTRYGTGTEGRKTYDSYHELLLLARSTMATNLASTRGGLFIDLHGHSHTYTSGYQEAYTSIITGDSIVDNLICQAEVGYGLDASLEQSDAVLNTMANYSSIAAIAQLYPHVPFSDMIRGRRSLGGYLESEGVMSVPGKFHRVLDRNAQKFGTTSGNPNRRPYYTGGFCTRKYGTTVSGGTTGFADNISAIQIEMPRINIRENASTRSRATHKFKRAIIQYLNWWFHTGYSNSAYPYDYYVDSRTLQVGGQTHASLGPFIAMANSFLYPHDASAADHSVNLDITYLWGNTTYSNLLVSSATAYSLWPATNTLVSAWPTRNDGILTKFKSATSAEITNYFTNVKTKAQIISKVTAAEGAASSRSAYVNSAQDGPGPRLTRLEIGDLVFFRSTQANRNVYAILKVTGRTTGTNGSLTMEMKRIAY